MTDNAASATPPDQGGLRTRGIRKQSRTGRPLVSIVTVVLNGEQTLEQTIHSVKAQTYDNIEYIVVDGGSTDSTIPMLEQHDMDIDYWISEPDAGIYDAMNKGITLAQGDLINLLNADDVLEPLAVETVVAAFLKQKMPCILYGDYRLIDSRLGYQVEMPSRMNVWLGMTVSHQSMFVHTEIYRMLGCYDTSYRLAADYHFLLRAVQNRVALVHTGMTIVSRRLYGRGGAQFLRSRLETNSINRLYFGGNLQQRMAFLVNSGIDALKLCTIKSMQSILGAAIVRKLMMRYYRSRKMTCSPIHG